MELAWATGSRRTRQADHVDQGGAAGNCRASGLSDICHETVKKMNRVGLLADLAHASFETTEDAAKISTQPILSTHSLVRAADGTTRGIGMTPAHAKLIAGTGGVIGTFGGMRGGMAGFVEHALRLIDTVGIGTDMDGTGCLPAAFDRYPLLPEATARLLGSGLDEVEVTRVIGGNVARVLEDARSGADKL